MEHLYQQSPQGSGNTEEHMSKSEERKAYCERLASGHGIAVACMNSSQMWVPAQDEEFKIPALELERSPIGLALAALPYDHWNSFPSIHSVAHRLLLLQSHGT